MIKRFLARWFVTRTEYERQQTVALETFKAIDENFRKTLKGLNTLGDYCNSLDKRARLLWWEEEKRPFIHK